MTTKTNVLKKLKVSFIGGPGPVRRSPCVARRSLGIVRRSPSAMRRSLSALRHSPSALRRPPGAVWSSPSALRRSLSALWCSLSGVRHSPNAIMSSPGSRMLTHEKRECPSCTGVAFYTVRDNSRPVRGQFAAQFAAQFAEAKKQGNFPSECFWRACWE